MKSLSKEEEQMVAMKYCCAKLLLNLKYKKTGSILFSGRSSKNAVLVSKKRGDFLSKKRCVDRTFFEEPAPLIRCTCYAKVPAVLNFETAFDCMHIFASFISIDALLYLFMSILISMQRECWN